MDLEIMNLLKESEDYILICKEKHRQYEQLEKQMKNLTESMSETSHTLDVLQRASDLINKVSNKLLNTMLFDIMKIMNKAISLLYDDIERTVTIEPFLLKDRYPQFLVKLFIGPDHHEQLFDLDGDGLKQIVSFLINLCVLDAKESRFMLLDEVLNGLHPRNKKIFKAIIESVSDRFQFMIIEYSLDVGTEYIADKSGETSTITRYDGNSYYQDYAS